MSSPDTLATAVKPVARRFRITALLTAALFVLAACGAEVRSELEFADDESGTRTLVATIAEDDLEYLEGGIDAAESALEAHLPEQLSFAGITEASDEDEDAADSSDGYLATFELEFSDRADYAAKAQALLDLAVEKEEAVRDSSQGEVQQKTVEVVFEQSDGPLLDGVILDENFTGADLLDWASYALVEEGVVAEEESDSVIGSTGTESRVVIGGEEYESSEPFSVSEGTDHRFSNVSVTITDSGTVVELAAAFNSGDHDTGFELGQQYLEDTGIGELESTDDGYWTVTLDDSASLQEQLSGLLGMDELEIQVEETANVENGTLLTTLTGTGFSCAAACRDTPSIGVSWGSESITPIEEEAEGDTFHISYERGVRVEQVDVETTIGMSGNIGQTYRFAVDSGQVEAFGDDLESVFAPPEGTGSIETETTDRSTVFVTTLDAVEPAELNATLEEFLPGSSISVSGFEGIWPEYRVNVNSYGVQALGATPAQNVNLPIMHSANQDASNGLGDDLAAEQTEYTLVAAGPTLSGLITLGVIIVVVVAAIVLIVVFRKRIATGLRSAQQQVAAMQAATPAAQAPGSQHERSAAAVPPEALLQDDEAWQAEFSEAKLH